MKKIVNERYKESYVEETLSNGLHVVLWQKPDYQKSLFMMATPLGALDIEQVDSKGNNYRFPAGIAHFLEHKMFETKEGDIMEEFSKMGANVNAFTSYTETVYYFTCASDVEKPLNLLLDFVQELNISEASVEKEKGIIIQELNMYKQMSDSRLLNETYASLFSKHPLRYDIGGDDKSVSSTTVEDLRNCYHLNYHPQRMVLVGVCSDDPKRIMEIIRKNQEGKHFEPIEAVKRKEFIEPKNTNREIYTFSMDIQTPKVSLSYKLDGIEDVKKRIYAEWCIRMMIDSVFSSLNPEYQDWIDQGIINDFVGGDIDFGKDYGVLMFCGETEKRKEFYSLIESVVERISKGDIQEDVLQQLKRRYFGQTIRSLNSFDDIAITFVRNYFDQTDFFVSLDILDKICLEDIKECCKFIVKEHKSIIEIMPEKSQ